MKPKLYSSTENNCDTHAELIACIIQVECSRFFNEHLGKSQSEQKIIVRDFQEYICNELTNNILEVNWQLEYVPSARKKDSVDIYGHNENIKIIIELDKHRADQVAKKFVSRSALFGDEPIVYISLCYPGTNNMNPSECIKYFDYCKKYPVEWEMNIQASLSNNKN